MSKLIIALAGVASLGLLTHTAAVAAPANGAAIKAAVDASQPAIDAQYYKSNTKKKKKKTNSG